MQLPSRVPFRYPARHPHRAVAAALLLALLLLLGAARGAAQQPPRKIRVVLLGTFHFNQSLDSTSKLHADLLSGRRQKEVSALVDRLAALRPDKIFLEFTPEDQPFWDSVYRDYAAGREPASRGVRANEIFQLGMKTARRLHLPGVTGINYQPADLATPAYRPANAIDSAMRALYRAFDGYSDTARTNAAFYDRPYPVRLPNEDSLLQRTDLTAFLRHVNSPAVLQRGEYTNWNYLYSIGAPGDQSATDYAGTFWYGTNVRNFNNVLRQADPAKDRTYLIIYGSSHIPFLRYLFSMHPYFEVVDADAVLR